MEKINQKYLKKVEGVFFWVVLGFVSKKILGDGRSRVGNLVRVLGVGFWGGGFELSWKWKYLVTEDLGEVGFR